MKHHSEVILRPVVSEKSYGLLDGDVYTFVVHGSASKPEIRDAVERAFPGTKVAKVNTLNRKGKSKRSRKSPKMAKLPDTKRAIVTVVPGTSQINLFEVG